MIKIFYFLVISSLLFSCGKQEKPQIDNNKIVGRVINPITEGSFTLAEKNLGVSFCNALSYKRTQFGSMYGAPSKIFKFEVEKKSCEKVENQFNQDLIYSTATGLSYASASAPAFVPQVETDSSGVFTTYCANQSQDARIFQNGSLIYIYHFFSGEICKGDSTQICAVYERAGATGPTNMYKKYLISTGNFLSIDLRGQEVFSEEQTSCDAENYQSQKITLRSAVNI